ncbi:MAG TPA: flagellar hook-length control protein FliK [Burkholderiales bacterium]|nr:flagellar hook-length control protein FliK [Burkholderiales bacterium]
MDTTAVARAPTPPATEAPAQREEKEDEESKPAAFDKKLKQELALLAPDAAKPAVDDAAAADAAGDATNVLDPAAVGDPSLAALEAARQPQLAALQAAAAAAAAGRPDASRDAAERRPVELNASDSSAKERSSVERLVSARETKERTMELAARRNALSSDERTVEGRTHTADDGAAPSAFSAAMAAPAAAPAFAAAAAAPAAGVPLDVLASAAMVAKWSGTPQNVSDAAPAPATARIDTPLGAQGWSDAFQQKIVWLADRQQQSAELHINPPHLGPVEVMLNFSEDGARIAFCSPHTAVREAIEASLPDLQAALGDRGVALSQTMVSADSGAAREQFSQPASQDSQGGSGARHGRGTGSTTPLAADAARPVIIARGLVDTFA